MKKIVTNSETETRAWARRFAKSLSGGEVISLEGNLGAGKTVIVKGIAQALGIQEMVNSPTFVLMKVYNVNGRMIKKLIHVDAYRLEGAAELLNIGLQEYLGQEDVLVVVEWGDKVKQILPKNHVTLRLEINDIMRRTISVLTE